MIKHLLTIDDVNSQEFSEGLAKVQDLFDQPHGDNAGAVFDNREEEWRKGSPDARKAIMHQYLQIEMEEALL